MNLGKRTQRSLNLREIETPDEVKQYSQLLDLGFGVLEGRHFFDDFPVWDPQFSVPSLIRLGVFHEDALVAAAAARVTTLKLGITHTMKVGIVGGVVTDASWRGQGLASQLVTRTSDWAQKKGALAALLWGSEHSLYHKLGFVLCGRQFLLPLASLSLSAYSDGAYRRGWTAGIFDLLQKRQEGLLLERRDIEWYGAHKNVEWFYSGSADQPRAYAAYGRGIDLTEIVHEWGGEKQEVLRLLYQISQLYPAAALLLGIDHLRQFEISISGLQPQFLCMAKILEPSQVILSSGLFPLSFWIWGLDGA